MLREIETLNDRESGHRKRWFNDSSMDLIIWYGSGDQFVRFQLCYDKNLREHALSWNDTNGFSHHRVDDGESSSGGHKKTPILGPDGSIDAAKIVANFRELSSSVDESVVSFICAKLESLLAAQRPAPSSSHSA